MRVFQLYLKIEGFDGGKQCGDAETERFTLQVAPRRFKPYVPLISPEQHAEKIPAAAPVDIESIIGPRRPLL